MRIPKFAALDDELATAEQNAAHVGGRGAAFEWIKTLADEARLRATWLSASAPRPPAIERGEPADSQ